MEAPKPKSFPIEVKISYLLAVCAQHLAADRLIKGDSAFACYQMVLEKEPNNLEAQVGITKIESRYVTLANSALDRRENSKAKEYLEHLRLVNPEAVHLAQLSERLLSNEPTLFRDRLKDGSLGPKMMWIPEGRFQMGSNKGGSDERPVHWVSISRFAIGKYEVTVDEYLRFAWATGAHVPEWQKIGSRYNIRTGRHYHYKKLGSALTNDNHPIVGISWHDAVAYAKWLSEQTGQEYRLPTEAEWEYAARAGTETEYWWGDEIGSKKANCNNCEDFFEYTAPVGSFAANPL